MAEVDRGTPLHSIVVTSLTPNGRPVNVKLDKAIGMKTLLRNTSEDRFREIWNQLSEETVVRTDALETLYGDYPFFRTNSRIFIQDLKRFGSKNDSQSRLLSTNHRFFLGEPYFSSEVVDLILALPLQPGTLTNHLDNLMDRKAERGQSEELCASHDLAPIFLRAFGLSWDVIKDERLELSSTKRVKRSKSVKRRSTMRGLRTMFSKMSTKEDQGQE